MDPIVKQSEKISTTNIKVENESTIGKHQYDKYKGKSPKVEIPPPVQQQTPNLQTLKYQGLFGTTRTVISEEGISALWKSIIAGLHRQIIFSGIRVGLYTPVKNMISGDLPEGKNPALYQKMLAAIITGAIGITVANPTDVVKVRL